MKLAMGNVQELLVDDLELLQREINEFCASNSPEGKETPKILENYLLYVAKTGNTVFPWQQIRPLFRYKLQSSIATFSEDPMATETEGAVYERFDWFRAAPFTIQRLSELITNPTQHYQLKEKYLLALEKAVHVVSTVEPSSFADGKEKGNGALENRIQHLPVPVELRPRYLAEGEVEVVEKGTVENPLQLFPVPIEVVPPRSLGDGEVELSKTDSNTFQNPDQTQLNRDL